jgi:hypothetical protein
MGRRQHRKDMPRASPRRKTQRRQPRDATPAARLERRERLLRIFSNVRARHSGRGPGNQQDGPVCLVAPPMLEAALGYEGHARFVLFHATAGGVALQWHDGRQQGRGWRPAWRLFVEHPAVRDRLQVRLYGQSLAEGKRGLVLDRQQRLLYVVDADHAAPFVQACAVQHPEPVPRGSRWHDAPSAERERVLRAYLDREWRRLEQAGARAARRDHLLQVLRRH